MILNPFLLSPHLRLVARLQDMLRKSQDRTRVRRVRMLRALQIAKPPRGSEKARRGWGSSRGLAVQATESYLRRATGGNRNQIEHDREVIYRALGGVSRRPQYDGARSSARVRLLDLTVDQRAAIDQVLWAFPLEQRTPAEMLGDPVLDAEEPDYEVDPLPVGERPPALPDEDPVYLRAVARLKREHFREEMDLSRYGVDVQELVQGPTGEWVTQTRRVILPERLAKIEAAREKARASADALRPGGTEKRKLKPPRPSRTRHRTQVQNAILQTAGGRPRGPLVVWSDSHWVCAPGPGEEQLRTSRDFPLERLARVSAAVGRVQKRSRPRKYTAADRKDALEEAGLTVWTRGLRGRERRTDSGFIVRRIRTIAYLGPNLRIEIRPNGQIEADRGVPVRIVRDVARALCASPVDRRLTKCCLLGLDPPTSRQQGLIDWAEEAESEEWARRRGLPPLPATP